MNTSGEERCCRLFSERDVDDLNAALLNHSGKYNLTHLPETFEERGSYIIKYLCLTGKSACITVKVFWFPFCLVLVAVFVVL